MKIKVTIEYDEETGKHSFETNASASKSGAAVATAMKFNRECAPVILAATGAYLSSLNGLETLGDKITDVAVLRVIANDELNAQKN